MRKYIKLATLIFLAVIGGFFLTAVWHEVQVFGLVTMNDEGENVGVLNGKYPWWFYMGIGASFAAIFWAILFTVKTVRSFFNGPKA